MSTSAAYDRERITPIAAKAALRFQRQQAFKSQGANLIPRWRERRVGAKLDKRSLSGF
jgi:hypothetical protein